VVTASLDTTARIWVIEPERGSAAKLRDFAELASGRALSSNDGIEWLSLEEIKQRLGRRDMEEKKARP
jgi:hypothetical protein